MQKRAGAHKTSLFQQALSLHGSGDLVLAEAMYSLILEDHPRHDGALHGLGVIALQRGELDEAMRQIRLALDANPRHADALSNLAYCLNASGRPAAALACCDRALAVEPGNPGALTNRGHALRALERHDEALGCFARVLRARPGHPESLYNHALALFDLRRYADAESQLRAALAAAPRLPGAACNLATTLAALGRNDEALEQFDRAVELEASNADAWLQRGHLLVDAGRHDEALESYNRAVTLRPDDAETWSSFAQALSELGRYGEAIECVQRAQSIDPDNALARFNESLCLLKTGDFENGWRRYEARFAAKRSDPPRPELDTPAWLGDPAPDGATILIHSEQGLGDTIQFSRYAMTLAERGARVVLEVQPELKKALADIEGASAVLARGDPLPAFDAHCPLMSLPLALGTTLETVPARVPYLRPDAETLGRWRARLGERTRPRVGIAWSGSTTHRNDLKRSMPFGAIAPLVDANPFCEFVVLQKDIRDADRAAIGERDQLVVAADAIGDFSDTAAIASLMDLVIAVDTSVAHLAGAIGAPVWILLPFDPDFRWLLERTDSPWYPTARLFRQPAPGDWRPVIAEVGERLRALFAPA